MSVRSRPWKNLIATACGLFGPSRSFHLVRDNTLSGRSKPYRPGLFNCDAQTRRPCPGQAGSGGAEGKWIGARNRGACNFNVQRVARARAGDLL